MPADKGPVDRLGADRADRDGVQHRQHDRGFPVAGGTSRFLFATEHGQILGWPGSGAAQLSAAQSFDPGAVYKGLAIATPPAGPRLYATDFHNGRVDVWDGSWNLVNPSSSFVDPSIPAGYAPFGIQRIGDTIFVTYAKQDADAEDDVHGQGLGFVDAYDTAGNLQGRVAQHGQLNAPWGLAMAPASFGRFANDLLVGNFGDGQINAYAVRRTATSSTGASCAERAASRSQSTASGRSSSGTTGMPARARRSSSPRARTTRWTGSSARSTRASPELTRPAAIAVGRFVRDGWGRA